jgi:P-type Mg2+ transporter
MLKSLFSKISPFLIVKEAKAGAKKITANEQRLVDFCAVPPEEAQTRLKTGAAGIDGGWSRSGARRVRAESIEGGREARSGHDILVRFKNPLVIQLMVIAIVSLATAQEASDTASAVVVGFMVLLSVGLGYFQERRSNKAVEKLQEMVQTNCVVIRDGKEEEIPMEEIVPGDLVVLHAGAIIPADLRLLTTKDFFIGQSALTGESMPVEKNFAPCDLADKGIIELTNACFQGSNVVSGTARAVVVNTGTGRISGPSRRSSRDSKW